VFDKIFGLPVHILVVHAVVVLVPLCAIGAVLMLVSRTWRERLRWPEVVLLTVAAGSAFVAKQSGEALKDHLGSFTNASLDRHVTLGTKAPWIVLAFWALTVAWLVLDARRSRPDGPAVSETTVRVLGILAVVAAAGATTWIVLTGDAGSRSLWGNVASAPSVASAVAATAPPG
jgi:glucan phosphoethanolaminetransferase (alkaline phosphatase superfamily)